MRFAVSRLEGWDGGKLEVLVTGRSAYVAEISLSMRHDIIVTVLEFDCAGRRRFLYRLSPLAAVAWYGSSHFCFVVWLDSPPAFLIFHRLNMVTVGFCAILVGLGVDFAILIYGRYQQARNEGDAIIARHRRSHSQSWPCDFLRRPNHRGWFSRPRPERFFRVHLNSAF